MKFNTIAEIQAHQFAGNAYSDQKAFSAIDDYVQDLSTTMADKAEALRVMCDHGMGLGRDEETSDEDIVQLYMNAFQ